MFRVLSAQVALIACVGFDDVFAAVGIQEPSEPIAGQFGNLLERAWFFKEMGRGE